MTTTCRSFLLGRSALATSSCSVRGWVGHSCCDRLDSACHQYAMGYFVLGLILAALSTAGGTTAGQPSSGWGCLAAWRCSLQHRLELDHHFATHRRPRHVATTWMSSRRLQFVGSQFGIAGSDQPLLRSSSSMADRQGESPPMTACSRVHDPAAGHLHGHAFTGIAPCQLGGACADCGICL